LDVDEGERERDDTVLLVATTEHVEREGEEAEEAGEAMDTEVATPAAGGCGSTTNPCCTPYSITCSRLSDKQSASSESVKAASLNPCEFGGGIVRAAVNPR
jgi:hypothetical protein